MSIITNNSSNPNRLFYWCLPPLVLAPLILMYFSGIRWMVEIVCPSINWELGILEHIQLLIILGIAGMTGIAAMKKPLMLEKLGWVSLSLFALLVFLEEIDYGAHHIEYFQGHRETFFSELTGSANIHNQGDNAKWFKRPVYLIMAVLFILFPFLGDRIKHPLLKYLTPTKMIIGTAVITILSDLIPRLIVSLGIREDGGLGTNIGEFSEIMVYYIFALYVYELVFKKHLVGWPVKAR